MAIELTAEAVARVLFAAGLDEADFDDYGSTSTVGFTTCDLPLAEPRVSVSWHSGYLAWSEEEVHSASATPLGACAEALQMVGYQTEFVADFPSGYLVVWTDGEF